MARELGLEPTRVNRLLKTLAHLGIAQQTPDKQYVSGPAMHVLAAQAMFGSGLLQRAVSPLESLRPFRLAIAMGVLWRDHVSYLYHGAPDAQPADALGRVGLFPATRSGIGLALLARLPESAVRALYTDREIPNFPDGVASLLKTLVAIRVAGVAIVTPYEGKSTQTIAIAIDHHPAAVALSGAIQPEQIAAIERELRRVAREISGPF